MKKINSVTEFFDREIKWKRELLLLRELCLATELQETLKWGIPVYAINKKNVVALAGFKNHFALWFYNGVFINDPKDLLINANEDKTKGLRQLRFNNIEEIDSEVISDFIRQAIENEKKGIRINISTKKKAEHPPELLTLFDANPSVASAFSKLTPFKQKEYCEYISDAKREDTRLRRIENIEPMIISGIGLHDKY